MNTTLEQFILKENDLLKANCRDETRRELRLEAQLWCPRKELVMHLSSAWAVVPERAPLKCRWESIGLNSFFLLFFSKMKFQWLCSSCSQTCLGFLVLVFESCMKLLNWQQDAAWFSSEQWPEKWETKACVVPGQCSAFSGMLPGPLVRALLICVIYQRWEGFGSKTQ